ncbi:MAG: energy-coupling factor transporter transmembrane component T [Spirochaetota bacterium]
MERITHHSAKMRRTLLGIVPVSSPLYYLHPVTRFISLIFLGVVPLFIELPEINVGFVILILLYLKWARVNISGLRIYLPLMFTVAMFMFTISILFPGKGSALHSFVFLGITFYLEPLYWTFASYWRLMAMLFGTIQYFTTNRERDTLVAIRTLMVPFAITYFLSLALRSAGMFMEDLRTIREAERARGLDESSLSLRNRAKLYAMYMIPLFTLAIRRADEISNALHARGYRISGKVEGGGKRHDYIMMQYSMHAIDIILIFLQALIFIAVAFLRIYYGMFNVIKSPLRQHLLSLWR